MSSEEDSINDNHYISEEEEPTKRRSKKKKDPKKPKRNMSAFFLYSNANRSRVKEENPDITFGEVAKLLSKEFKNISAEERAKYDKLALEDKERYKREMEDYEPPSDDDEAPAKKKKKKDPNAPKRNMSAYFIYSQDIRSTVRVENPEAGFGDIAKIISKQFKALSEAERKKYDNLALEDKARYQRDMALYNGN